MSHAEIHHMTLRTWLILATVCFSSCFASSSLPKHIIHMANMYSTRCTPWMPLSAKRPQTMLEADMEMDMLYSIQRKGKGLLA